MIHDFDEEINRYGTDSTQWDLLAYKFGESGLLPFWMADMDFRCAQPIIDALKKRVDHGIFGYTKPCTESYVNAVINWYSRRYGWDIEPDWIVYVPNAMLIAKIALDLFTLPGDKVIIQSPVYNLFERVVVRNGRYIANNQLKLVDGRYEIDFDQLEELAKDPLTRAMILCNPHNPVGRMWSREELRKIANICLENDVLLISDEIHGDLGLWGKRYTPVASLSKEIADNTIVCTAPTKTFNISGFFIANAIIPNDDLRWRFEEEIKKKMCIHSAPVLAVEAMKAAYNESEYWLEQLIKYIEGNMNFIESFFKENLPKVKFNKPEATYFAWLDFRDFNMSRHEIESLLWHKAKVAAYEGTIFGPGGEGFVRFVTACPRRKIEKGLRRIAEVFKEY